MSGVGVSGMRHNDDGKVYCQRHIDMSFCFFAILHDDAMVRRKPKEMDMQEMTMQEAEEVGGGLELVPWWGNVAPGGPSAVGDLLRLPAPTPRRVQGQPA